MNLVEFIITVTLLTLMPGPDIIYVLSQSVIGGARRGITIAAGLCTGLVVYSVLVAVGVGAMIAANPAIFYGLKIAGALYLVYLAVMSLLSLRESRKNDAREMVTVEMSGWGYYKRGLIMNLLNPKVALFFLSLFPPFITDQSRAGLYTFALGGVCVLIGMTVFSLVALFAGVLNRRFVRREGNGISSIWVVLTQVAIYLFIVVMIFL